VLTPPGARRRAHPLRVAWALVRDAARGFVADDAPRHGAALAYYALFSVAPLLLLATAIAGLVYDEASARAEVSARLFELVGAQGAAAVEGLLTRALPTGAGLVPSIIGVTTTLLGASTVFVQLRGSLDQVWKVPSHETAGVVAAAWARVIGVGMVLLTGALLLASLAMGTVLRVAGAALATSVGLPTGALDAAVPIASFVLVTAAFAAIFKLVPSVRVPWGAALVGAVVTAALFTVGRVAVGAYLAYAGVATAYGAAGSLVAFLVWVYASAQIVLFGAEITRVWAIASARRPGTEPPPPSPRAPRRRDAERSPPSPAPLSGP